jgi:hypothetical protein
MSFSPINNYNSGNNFKSGTMSRSFNDGTEELLRNVLGGTSLNNYKSREGDSLTLSLPGFFGVKWAVIDDKENKENVGGLVF